MKVLIACEYSGIVRDAFIARGHDAMSCDLKPTQRPGPHFQGDVLEIIDSGWDLMVAHPPCTYLSYAGTSSWNLPGRAELREAALQFFLYLYNAPIERICVENPQGYPYVAFRRPDQVIDPYHFGDQARKRTALWLRNLPPLMVKFTGPPPEPTFKDKNGKARYFVDALPSGHPDRNKSFEGIAQAMAEQWG